MTTLVGKHLQNFIRHITTAAATASLYHLEHPQVQRLCCQAWQELMILQESDSQTSLKIIDNRLIYASQPVKHDLSIEKLIVACKKHGITYLQFDTGITHEELLGLISVISKRANCAPPKRYEHLHFGQLEVRYQKGSGANNTYDLSQFAEVNDHELDKFMEIYHQVRKTKHLNIVGINEIVNNFVTTFSCHSEAFMALAPLRSMDEYTYTHCTNICLLNLAQARLLGIEGPLLNEIGIAAMLHDVGKMFIPEEILNKSGKLDKEEWELIQQHPQLGAEYLMGTHGAPRLAIITAYEHHMRYDGKGYPKTNEGWNLNVCSYMTNISDIYDALRTRRTYKESLSFQEVCTIMLEEAGRGLHPELTRSFLTAIGSLENTN